MIRSIVTSSFVPEKRWRRGRIRRTAAGAVLLVVASVTEIVLFLAILLLPRTTMATVNVDIDNDHKNDDDGPQQQLYCETQADGLLLCKFTLDRRKNQKLAMHFCLDNDDGNDDGFCVDVQVEGKSKGAGENSDSSTIVEDRPRVHSKQPLVDDKDDQAAESSSSESKLNVDEKEQEPRSGEPYATTNSFGKEEEDEYLHCHGDDDDDSAGGEMFDDEAQETEALNDDEEVAEADDSQNAEARNTAGNTEQEALNSESVDNAQHVERERAEEVKGSDPQESLVKSDPNGTMIIGDVVYTRPYRQYGKEVATSLRQHSDSQTRVQEAMWLYTLGLAHQAHSAPSVVDDDDDDDVDDKAFVYRETTKIDEGEVKKALNAFTLAAHIFEGIRDGSGSAETRDDAAYQLANVYFQFSETYSMSEENHGTLPLVYMMQAEELYRGLSDSNESNMDQDYQDQALESRALCCTQIAVLLLGGNTQKFQDSVYETIIGMDGDDLGELLNDPDEAEQLLGTTAENYLSTIAQAETYLDTGIQIYNKLIEKANDPKRVASMQLEIAMAWQSKANAATLRGDTEKGIEYTMKAIELYRLNLSGRREGSTFSESIALELANLLHSLSDQYFQVGMYDEALASFTESMQLHEKYDLLPPVIAESSVSWNEEETIEVYEQALEDYQTAVNGALNFKYPDDDSLAQEIFDTDIHFYEQDEGYEGDLHATLGSMYLSLGNPVQAEGHLIQAIRLYEKIGDDSNEESLADAKYNLAMLHSQNGQYMESIKLYREAVDLFRGGVFENPWRIRAKSEIREITIKKGSRGGADGTSQETKDDEESSEEKEHDRIQKLSAYWKEALTNQTGRSDEEL